MGGTETGVEDTSSYLPLEALHGQHVQPIRQIPNKVSEAG